MEKIYVILKAAYLCFASNTGLMLNSMVKAARFRGDNMVKFLDMKDPDNWFVSIETTYVREDK